MTRGVLDPVPGRFAHELRAAADDLREIVDRHWVVTWDLRGREPHRQEVLPHPCVNLAFESGGRAGVYGIPASVFTRQIDGAGWAVGVRLRPGALSVYADVDAAGLTDTVAPLEAVLGDAAHGLADAVLAAEDTGARIACAEAWLRAHRRPLSADAALVQAVVEAMLRAPAGTTVAGVAAAHGMTPRTLQRLFRRHVGVSPKWVLQRYRIHEAAERLAADPGQDLARLALDLGYADQAHFSADFHARTGRTPSAYPARAGHSPEPCSSQ